MNLAGWDLVFAIAIAEVNSALDAQQAKLIRSFKLKGPVVAEGVYGNWKIVPGGSGSLVQMAITLKSGTLHEATGEIALAGGTLIMKVALAMLPATNGVQHLVFDLKSKAASFTSLSGLPALNEFATTALGMAFAADLSSRAAEISFVLASISPVAAGGPAWLNPKALAFAYVVPEGAAPALGIFAVTTERDIEQLDRRVDPSLIGPGGVGLALAPSLFLANVFAPALESAFGAPVGSIVITGPTTLGSNQQISLQSVSKAGENYYPVVNKLTAELVDDRVNIVLSGSCDMRMGISMTFNGNSSIGISVGTPGALAFATIGTPSFSKDVDIPWYDHLLDIAGGLAEAILDITVAAISSELADGVSHVAGTSAIATQAPDIVGWVGAHGFTPTDAGLSNCLWLRGKID